MVGSVDHMEQLDGVILRGTLSKQTVLQGLGLDANGNN